MTYAFWKGARQTCRFGEIVLRAEGAVARSPTHQHHTREGQTPAMDPTFPFPCSRKWTRSHNALLTDAALAGAQVECRVEAVSLHLMTSLDQKSGGMKSDHRQVLGGASEIQQQQQQRRRQQQSPFNCVLLPLDPLCPNCCLCPLHIGNRDLAAPTASTVFRAQLRPESSALTDLIPSVIPIPRQKQASPWLGAPWAPAPRPRVRPAAARGSRSAFIPTPCLAHPRWLHPARRSTWPDCQKWSALEPCEDVSRLGASPPLVLGLDVNDPTRHWGLHSARLQAGRAGLDRMDCLVGGLPLVRQL